MLTVCAAPDAELGVGDAVTAGAALFGASGAVAAGLPLPPPLQLVVAKTVAERAIPSAIRRMIATSVRHHAHAQIEPKGPAARSVAAGTSERPAFYEGGTPAFVGERERYAKALLRAYRWMASPSILNATDLSSSFPPVIVTLARLLRMLQMFAGVGVVRVLLVLVFETFVDLAVDGLLLLRDVA